MLHQHEEDGAKVLQPLLDPESRNTSWDGPDDPNNPMNWSFARRMSIVGLVNFASLNDALAAAMINPIVPQIKEDLHCYNPSISSLLISVHVIGFAIGPLFFTPVSEIYGRNPLMHASNVMFLLSSVLGALSTNLTMMIVARILVGIAGSAPSVLGIGYIADLIPVEERGRIMGLWACGPLLGMAIGPIISGYLALLAGWRWAFWFGAIVSSAQTLVGIVVLKETFAPIVIQRINGVRQHCGTGQFWTAISRPIQFMVRSPIVMISSLNISVVYVYFYFVATSLPEIFGDQYGFNTSELGLVYLSPTLGYILGMFTVGPLSDWHLRKKEMVRGTIKPEDRLFALLPGNILVAIGMLCFGWSTQLHLHWLTPIAGFCIITIGTSCVFMAIDLYLADSFNHHVVGALALTTVMRSILGAVLPTTAPLLYSRLGYGWGYSVMGFISLSLAPVALLLVRYGEWLRTHPRFHVI